MDPKQAGSSLDSLISSFNTRVADLQELVIARNNELTLYPASRVTDLSAIDAALKGMELQVKAIKDQLREETDAIPESQKAFKQQPQRQQPNQGNKTEEPTALPKEKKSRGSPLWYMRGRLTLERGNATISEMAAYVEANAQLVTAPKMKLVENLRERALVSES